MSMEGLRGSFLDVKRSSVVEGISNEALATFLASGALAIGAVWLSLDRNRRAAPGASGAAGGDVANDPPPSETLPAPSPASAPPLSGNYWSSTAEIPTCPICLESVQWACETSCGHAFCAACFLTWSQRFAMRTVTCPMDRRQVHAVYASAALRRRHQRAPGHVPPSPSEVTRHAELDEQLLRFNERNGAGWVHENARWALRAFRQWEFVPLQLRVQIFSVMFLWVVYLLLPIDLIPESVFGVVGLVDDALMLPLLISVAGGIFRASVTGEHR